jgi:hypothetical protein
MCLGDLLDDWVVKQQRSVCSDLHVALDKRLRTEGRVCCELDAVLFRKLEKVGLDVVWVVLNLECRRLGLSVCEHIKEDRASVVGYSNALGQTLLLEVLEGSPCVF